MAELINKGVPGIPQAALDAITDQNTQMVLRAIVDGWQVRNGASGGGDSRFITKGEIGDLVVGTVSQSFGLSVGTPGRPSIVSEISRTLAELQAEVINSRLWQELGERITTIEIPSIFTRIGQVEVVISNEVQRLEAADMAQVIATNTLGVRVGNNEAAQQIETTVRANSDNALASAINTMWALVGNNAALVQEGQQVTANQVGAVAEKWNQVQATIKDPVSGEYIATAAVRDYFKAEADRVNNRLTAEYTVKVDLNGYVAGFGIIANQDMTSGATSSAFGVRADQFFVGSPGVGNNVPFIIRTTPTSLPSGRVVQPGVYMNYAMVDQLYGTYIAAGLLDATQIYSGSEWVDKISNVDIPAVAVSTWNGSIWAGAIAQTSGSLRFYGPYHHGYVPKKQRVRGGPNGGAVNFLVGFSGVVDHWVTIWFRINGGGWIPLLVATEPQDSYGTMGLVGNAELWIGPGDYVDFGVSATLPDGSVKDSGKVDIYDMSFYVAANNIG